MSLCQNHLLKHLQTTPSLASKVQRGDEAQIPAMIWPRILVFTSMMLRVLTQQPLAVMELELDAGRERLQRAISGEVSALDLNGVRKWTKHPNAPGNESELRESYLFPNRPSYLVHRLVIAKCILYMWYLGGVQRLCYDPVVTFI